MYLILYIIIVNMVAVFLFGLDKRRAQNHQWRISERTLFTVALIGGSIGAQMGMLCFRHKTKHARFKLGIPLIFIAQVLTLIYTFRTSIPFF